MKTKILLTFFPFIFLSCYSSDYLNTLESKNFTNKSVTQFKYHTVEIDNYECDIRLPKLWMGNTYDLKVKVKNTSNHILTVTPKMFYILYNHPVNGSKVKSFAASPLYYRLTYEKSLEREEIKFGYYGDFRDYYQNIKMLVEELNNIDQNWLKRTTLFPNEYIEGTIQISIPANIKSLKLFFSDGLNSTEIPIRIEGPDN